MKITNAPILLVEDDQVDVMTVKRALKEIHVTNPLVNLENGEEALKYLRDPKSTKPCIILLDLNMPIMNGIEFLQVAKRDAQLKCIPVVVLTTSEEQQDKVNSFNLGVAGYESGEPLRCEYRLFTRAGEVRWFLNEASLVRHASGEPLFLQGVLVDITKDKEVEAELHLHRRRLEELVADRTMQFEKQTGILESANANLANRLDACTQAGSALKKYADQLADLYHNAPCGYYSLDPDGVFTQINDAGLKWLGYTREEIVCKMKFTDLLTPASGKTFLESYQHFKEGGCLRDLQLEITNKEGMSLPVLLNATAIKDAAGRFVMSRSMMFDITGYKFAEQVP